MLRVVMSGRQRVDTRGGVPQRSNLETFLVKWLPKDWRLDHSQGSVNTAFFFFFGTLGTDQCQVCELYRSTPPSPSSSPPPHVSTLCPPDVIEISQAFSLAVISHTSKVILDTVCSHICSLVPRPSPFFVFFRFCILY